MNEYFDMEPLDDFIKIKYSSHILKLGMKEAKEIAAKDLGVSISTLYLWIRERCFFVTVKSNPYNDFKNEITITKKEIVKKIEAA